MYREINTPKPAIRRPTQNMPAPMSADLVKAFTMKRVAGSVMFISIMLAVIVGISGTVSYCLGGGNVQKAVSQTFRD